MMLHRLSFVKYNTIQYKSHTYRSGSVCGVTDQESGRHSGSHGWLHRRARRPGCCRTCASVGAWCGRWSYSESVPYNVPGKQLYSLISLLYWNNNRITFLIILCIHYICVYVLLLVLLYMATGIVFCAISSGRVDQGCRAAGRGDADAARISVQSRTPRASHRHRPGGATRRETKGMYVCIYKALSISSFDILEFIHSFIHLLFQQPSSLLPGYLVLRNCPAKQSSWLVY